VLQRAANVVGLDAVATKVLELRGSDVVSQDFQSDRTSYGPFLSDVQPVQLWYAVGTGIERRSSASSMGGSTFNGATIVGTPSASYVVRDTAMIPSETAHGTMYSLRPLNAWAVIADWQTDSNARVVERCPYRDYQRLVLTRKGQRGLERLFIDEKSGFPVKLEREEPHYLWGQNRVEYVYSTWQRIDDAAYPGVSFRVVDGQTNVERNLSSIRLVSPDSAPSLRVPPSEEPMGFAPPRFLMAVNPDTIRVGRNAFLLKNPGYAEMVVQSHDTVFVFDATQGERRAQLDSVWIGKLFPGAHAIALVVTDLAWPHVAGVRYWAAQHVPIYAHRAAVKMLDSIIARRWTLTPDRLERMRTGGKVRIIPVSDTLRVGGGDLLLFAIDGASSEVALAAFDGRHGILWGSDYIQDARAPTMYLDEICRAVTRVRRTPVKAAAEHLPVTSWTTLRALARCD
jgi:hypothetical protein